jgi:hypothetical protein
VTVGADDFLTLIRIVLCERCDKLTRMEREPRAQLLKSTSVDHEYIVATISGQIEAGNDVYFAPELRFGHSAPVRTAETNADGTVRIHLVDGEVVLPRQSIVLHVVHYSA